MIKTQPTKQAQHYFTMLKQALCILVDWLVLTMADTFLHHIQKQMLFISMQAMLADLLDMQQTTITLRLELMITMSHIVTIVQQNCTKSMQQETCLQAQIIQLTDKQQHQKILLAESLENWN